MANQQISLTGTDTLSIFGRTITAFGTGDYFTFTLDAELFKVEVGKDGNAVYAFNAPGLVTKGVLKVLRGSRDDRFLNNLLAGMVADPSSFVLGTCVAVKRIGNGSGTISSDVYLFGGAVFSKFPGVKGNAQGETDQALVSYEIMFTSVTRVEQ